VVLRFEGNDAGALKRIQEDFRKVLQPLKPDAPLPY
jgi:phosphomannomutase/phosphoglucomutase